MRISAIAEELIKRDSEVIFIGKISEIKWLETRIKNLGFSQIFEQDLQFNSNPITDILIIDSYHISPHSNFLNIKNWRAIVSLVDDFTPQYNANLFIRPGVTEAYKSSNGTKYFAGPMYIPLRNSLISKTKKRNESSKLEILVVGGGTNLNNFVGEIAKILKILPYSFNANLLSNLNEPINMDSRFKFIEIGPEFDEKVGTADLIFTTAGTTSLEFIALGIPIGIACAVDNQRNNFYNLAKFGIAAPIGSFEFNSWNLDQKLIFQLISDKSIREVIKLKCKNFTDSNGAKRIVDLVFEFRK
jgi:spore coat polysaccharide biosynthesis predicted glycosyltransferase SpsG